VHWEYFQRFLSATETNTGNIAAYGFLFRRTAYYKKLADQAADARVDKSYLRRALPAELELDDATASRIESLAMLRAGPFAFFQTFTARRRRVNTPAKVIGKR